MKNYAQFSECKLSSVKPTGWLRESLWRFRNGLTGHLERAGYPFNSVSWYSDESKNPCEYIWEPYEQTAYWVDGMLRCGTLLGDSVLIKKAHESIDHVLSNPGENGYLGPKRMQYLTENRKNDQSNLAEYKKMWRWPQAVLFRAFMALSPAEPIAMAMAKHYRGDADWDYATGREILNLETALWAAHVQNDQELREQALNWYETFNRKNPKNHSNLSFLLSGQKDNQHGVTFNEMAKLGAIVYLHTGDTTSLRASENAYHKIDRDQMLVDGVPSSSEMLQGKNPLDAHETCDIADFIWSVGYLLMATGDARYADKIERALFNAGYGAITPDAKALQYFSCPNQVISDSQSNHTEMFCGKSHMSYRPNPGTACCPGDVNRIVPGYASRMWMRSSDDGIVAALYGPGCFHGSVNEQDVFITQETNYPFGEKISFKFELQNPTQFTFTLRIPGWCQNPILRINGKEQSIPLWSGSFIPINREYKNGDHIDLELPMTCKISHWPEDGIAIERGPIVYSLEIKEKWTADKADTSFCDEMPAWNIYAASPWNYGLALNENNVEENIKVIESAPSKYPWENPSLSLEVPAYRLDGWDLSQKDIVSRSIGNGDGNEHISKTNEGSYKMTPPLPSHRQRKKMVGAKEVVRFVPYGTTQLRMTILPDVSAHV